MSEVDRLQRELKQTRAMQDHISDLGAEHMDRADHWFLEARKFATAVKDLEKEQEHLLHTMHDAAKFADETTKAILEGVLHQFDYATRKGPFRGNKCACPFCEGERL